MPERLRRLQVDNQLDLGRLLHRQVGRLFAFQDAARVGAGKAFASAKSPSRPTVAALSARRRARSVSNRFSIV